MFGFTFSSLKYSPCIRWSWHVQTVWSTDCEGTLFLSSVSQYHGNPPWGYWWLQPRQRTGLCPLTDTEDSICMHSPALLVTAAEQKQSGSWKCHSEGKYFPVVSRFLLASLFWQSQSHQTVTADCETMNNVNEFLTGFTDITYKSVLIHWLYEFTMSALSLSDFKVSYNCLKPQKEKQLCKWCRHWCSFDL